MTNAIYVFIMLLCFVSSFSKNCTTYGLHSFSYRGFKTMELSSGSCFRTADFTDFKRQIVHYDSF